MHLLCLLPLAILLAFARPIAGAVAPLARIAAEALKNLWRTAPDILGKLPWQWYLMATLTVIPMLRSVTIPAPFLAVYCAAGYLVGRVRRRVRSDTHTTDARFFLGMRITIN